MNRPGRIPAQALSGWLDEVCALLELEHGLDAGTDGAMVLDLTRDIAYQVARPAGPLTMFALGLALGPGHSAGEPLGPRLADLAEQIRELADDRDVPDLPDEGSRS